MAHSGQSHLPVPGVSKSKPSTSPESKHQIVTHCHSDRPKDPSGSDDSLIDISEEGLPYGNQLISAENTNQLNTNSRKETTVGQGSPLQQTSANTGLLLAESKNRPRSRSDLLVPPVTSHGSSNSGITHKNLKEGLSSGVYVPTPEKKEPSGNLLQFSGSESSASDTTPPQTHCTNALGALPKPSHEFQQELFQSRFLQAQLQARHHQAPPGQPGDHFFLGDPTFAGSFSPALNLNPTADFRNTGSEKGARGSDSQDSTRSDHYTADSSEGHLFTDHVTDRVPDQVPSSSHRPSSTPRRPLIPAGKAAQVDGGWIDDNLDARPLTNSASRSNSSIPFDRSWNPTSRDYDTNWSIAATHKIASKPLAMGDREWQVKNLSYAFTDEDAMDNINETAVTRGQESGASRRQGLQVLQGYENATAVDDASDPSSVAGGGLARESPPRPQAANVRPDSSNDLQERPGGQRGRAARRPRPVAFQRNSYGEYSPLPHTSFDMSTVCGDAADEHRLSGAMTSYRHCHRANPGSSVDKVAKRQLVAVVALCLTFMIGEAVGGALSNSLALFTDVLHLGSDLISFIISLFALFLSNKGATKKMSFGYHRAEVLGALFSVFLIWLVSGVLCYIAVERIIHEHYKNVKADEMLITASLGVVFNIIMALVLHSEWCCKSAHSHSKFGHGHSHGSPSKGHSHAHQGSEYEPLQSAVDFDDEYMERRDVDEGKTRNGDDLQYKEMRERGGGGGGEEAMGEAADNEHHHQHKNLNVRAAFIHVIGDIIQSLGVLVAALIIKLQPEEKYRLADPICTFLFSILVLITTIAVLRDTISVLMEGVPRDLQHDKLKRDLFSLDGVVMVHSLQIWALTISRNAIAVHLAVDDPRIHDQVLSSATYLIQTRYQFYYSTIQVELYDPGVMTTCQKCLEFED